ncbi:MAG: flagellin [Kangiellaceae bacterium]|nr:flagellin [Kangiellaceae bacterium]
MGNVIQTNVSSIGAQRSLARTNEALSTTFQRLSTGLRINSAKDDAAGLQISNALTSQINGLGVAVRNANDGISIAQTAEGALQETTNILQRIRDLSIQSANGTNSSEQRSALQQEVSQLQQEITRIADTTSFGGRNLLDGTFGTSLLQVGSEANQTISITVNNAKATSLGSDVLSATGTVINSTVAAAVNTNGINAETDLSITTADGGTITGIAYAVNSDAQTIADAINTAASGIGITATATNSVSFGNLSATSGETVSFTLNGTAVSTTLDNANDLTQVAAAINGVQGSTGITATFASSTDKTSLTLTAIDGRDISLAAFAVTTDTVTFDFGATAGIAEGTAELQVGTLTLDSSKGAVTLATGDTEVFATASQQSQFSSVNDIDISSAAGAQLAIDVLDAAIQGVDSNRADLGAIQNRLSSTISNLGSIIENVSAARSRIRDTDFASETAELAKNQVLQQAGLSILAQANASSQSVLSLLQ